MVLHVRHTPTRFPTNSLYTPVDKHTLAFCIKCVLPVGQTVVVATVMRTPSEAEGRRDSGISATNVPLPAAPPCSASM